MDFKVLGDIAEIETIASGSGIRELARLRKRYGRGRWRKRKGYAEVRLSDGTIIRAELHWYEATGIASLMAKASRRLVICLDNSGYEVSLERRKIYVVVPDAEAARHGRIRVVDESGDDYLYPAERFVEVELPLAARRAVMQAA
jgi:hypothetical protein